MRIVLSLIVLLAVASVTPSRPPEPQQAPPPAQAPPVRQFVSVPAQAPEVAPCCPCCVGERCTCGAKCDCVCESKAKADDCACGCTDGKPCACPVCPQYLTGAKAKAKASAPVKTYRVVHAGVAYDVPADCKLVLPGEPGFTDPRHPYATRSAVQPVQSTLPFVSAPSVGCADGSCTVPSFNYAPPPPMTFGGGFGAGFGGGACIGGS